MIPKKKEAEEPPPPPAPAEPKIKNPGGETYALRVDVPIVNLDVSVILDKNHQFVPGLKAGNFLVLEDGVEQKVDTVRIGQTPITAVMLLEFAANSYYFINDMRNAAAGFFHSLRPDDYVAVMTYDLQTHILSDFTNNKDVIAESLNSLTLPGFSDTDMFDALYETLDRTSRIDGRKYIILIGTGRDTFSKITLDKMLAKIKATPNVTIFTIGTGALLNEMSAGGGMREMNYLQAQNQLKTFAEMTGGLELLAALPGRAARRLCADQQLHPQPVPADLPADQPGQRRQLSQGEGDPGGQRRAPAADAGREGQAAEVLGDCARRVQGAAAGGVGRLVGDRRGEIFPPGLKPLDPWLSRADARKAKAGFFSSLKAPK